jgi:hypothetical protein
VLESTRVDYAHRLLGLRVNEWVFGATLLVAGALSARLVIPALRESRVSNGSGLG